MTKPLRLLIIEDSEDDALLLVRELRKGGYDPESLRVETRDAMLKALADDAWDLIISDYVLPSFSGTAALDVLRQSRKDLPFIIVSGNIGEDIAVDAMKAGAHDYIIKGNLKRLVPAVDRELREAESRRERDRAERLLAEQSRLLEAFFRHAATPLVFLDRQLNFIRVNDAYARACRRREDEFPGRNYFDLYPSDQLKEKFERVVATGEPYRVAARPFLFSDHPEWGVSYWDMSIIPILDAGGSVDFLVFSLQDVTERREVEERMTVTNRLLAMYAQKFSRKEYLDSALELIQTWSGCRHAGIRLADDEGRISYTSCRGFDAGFLDAEGTLALDGKSCFCARVVLEEPDVLDRMAMTPSGSFYSNNFQAFFERVARGREDRYREACAQRGYRSMAVVPIRYREQVVGAMHLADDREGMLPLKNVEVLEQNAYVIGEALFRFGIEEDLRRNHEQLTATNVELRNLQAHIEAVREGERAHIAREVHDQLGQVMTALKMDIAWLQRNHPSRDAAVRERSAEMLNLIDGAIHSVKRITSELRPTVLDDFGLQAAVEWAAKEFEKRSGVTCSVRSQPAIIMMDRTRSTVIYRVLQESLTNVARHAGARNVAISLDFKEGWFRMTIEDDGKGIPPEKIDDPASYGLMGMKERLRFLGGEVSISGKRGRGTIVTASIPLAETDGPADGTMPGPDRTRQRTGRTDEERNR